MVATYRYLRDNAKPVSWQDAADLAKVRTFTPPTREELRRIRKHQRDVAFVERARAYAPLDAGAAMARDFMKQQKSILGGTRTVAAWTPPVYEKPRPVINQIEPVQKREMWPERPPLGPSPRTRRKLEQDRLIALWRQVFNPAQLDWVAIDEAFGCAEKFWEAVK
jgi:hypothetical protein